MKLTPENLEKNNYVFVDSFSHNEIKTFIKKTLKEEPFSVAYYLFLAALAFSAGLFSYTLSKNFFGGEIELLTTLAYIAIGVLISLAFIPFHEWIHALGYKLVGAKKISYLSNFKKIYFATTAHYFVTNYKEFRLVALLPFIFATLLSVVLLLFVNTYWSISLVTFFMLHTLFSSGDFALLNYMKIIKIKVS